MVKQVSVLPSVDPAAMAFGLLMRRLRGALGSQGQCDISCSDPACTLCAVEVLNYYHGTERDLLKEYKTTLREVNAFLKGQQKAARIAI